MIQQQNRDLITVSKEIEDLRCVLNEIVADMENSKKEVLYISQQLDKLINEYMAITIETF